MRRIAAGLALLGFLLALVLALITEAPLVDALERALLWAGTLLVLGLGVGWAGKTLMAEVSLGPVATDGETAATEAEHELKAKALMEGLIGREREKSPKALEAEERTAEKTESPTPSEDMVR